MYAKNIRPSAKRKVQTERKRSATIESRALGVLKFAREARDENVSLKWADFLVRFYPKIVEKKPHYSLLLDDLFDKKYKKKGANDLF